MKDVTLGQGIKILEMVKKKKIPAEQIQKLFSSGFLSDLLDGNVDRVKRTDFRRLMGLRPLLFPIWKTIILGVHKSSGAYCEALKVNRFRASLQVSIMLDYVKFRETQTQVNLVMVTVADLGFKEKTDCHQIYERAIDFGLALCPAEVGPALRLQYPDQPYGELIRVASEPIFVSESEFNGGKFEVSHLSGHRCLFRICGDPLISWDIDTRWVFLQ